MLAPNCYICRLLAGGLKHSEKDDVLIVGLVTGYAECRTQHTVDWVPLDICEAHARKFEKTVKSVADLLLEGRG